MNQSVSIFKLVLNASGLFEESGCFSVTLVPEVFLDFSPPERREPQSGDRFYDTTSCEASRKKNFGLESHFHADASCQTRQIYNYIRDQW